VKALFRRLVGLAVALPFAASVWLLTPFVGRERAIARCGPWGTALAAWLVDHLLLPRLSDAAAFDTFGPRLGARVRWWRPFYDVSVLQPDADRVQLHITSCLFCEAFATLGLAEINPYVCQGDWEAARRHAGLWRFERRHQIGTGDAFCDHTYCRMVADAGPGGGS
jgi:hypothetical protein